MRHISAYLATSSALPSAVGPGDRLSTMGRPDFLIAPAIIRISSGLYGWSAMQSTLMKSTAQLAYSFMTES